MSDVESTGRRVGDVESTGSRVSDARVTSAEPGATLVHSARISTGGSSREGWLTIENGVITALASGRPPVLSENGIDSALPNITSLVDAGGRLLAPGLIDLHCHGGGGAAFTDDASSGTERLDRALLLHQRHGTTGMLISLVTAGLDALEQQLGDVAAAMRTRPQILGIHLEGPFLDAGHKGAHDPALLTRPTPGAVDRLIAAGDGALRQVTLAPELPGAMDALRRCVDAGIVVAVGHTDADYSTAIAAFEAGATVLTHAFNGMNGMHHRLPGPVAAAIDHGGITIEVIADGVHVHPSMVHLLFAAAPGRVALITDAMAAAGHDDGRYQLGSLEVIVADGVARLAEGDSIAGSTLTLDAAVRNAVTASGISLDEAVMAATSVPASALGRSATLGEITEGRSADLVLFDDDLRAHTVWAAGRIVA